MEKRKFKVGDKVKYVNDSGDEYFGEVLKADHQSDLIVGLKNFNGHSCAVTNPDLINYIQQKGYVGRCVHLESIRIELVEEKEMDKKSTGNKVIDLLMEELGVEVDEEFEILGEWFNPYHFRNDGWIINSKGDNCPNKLINMILGEVKIKKIPKPEIKEMTVAELEEALKLPKGTLRVKGDK